MKKEDLKSFKDLIDYFNTIKRSKILNQRISKVDYFWMEFYKNSHISIETNHIGLRIHPDLKVSKPIFNSYMTYFESSMNMAEIYFVGEKINKEEFIYSEIINRFLPPGFELLENRILKTEFGTIDINLITENGKKFFYKEPLGHNARLAYRAHLGDQLSETVLADAYETVGKKEIAYFLRSTNPKHKSFKDNLLIQIMEFAS